MRIAGSFAAEQFANREVEKVCFGTKTETLEDLAYSTRVWTAQLKE